MNNCTTMAKGKGKTGTGKGRSQSTSTSTAKDAEKMKDEKMQNMHKYIRLQQRVRPKVSSLDDGAGNLTETEQEAADTLNWFFKSVFLG